MNSKIQVMEQLKANLAKYPVYREENDITKIYEWLEENDRLLSQIQTNTTLGELNNSEMWTEEEHQKMRDLKQDILYLSQQNIQLAMTQKQSIYRKTKEVELNVKASKLYLNNSRFR